MHQAKKDRVQGILLGLAAGDRNGGPIQMALLLAESLAALHTFDPDDVFRRYLEWWKKDGFDTGPTAEAVFSKVAEGMPIAEAVFMADQEVAGATAGCNPAHRSAPLAMAAFLPMVKLPTLAAQEARLTHCHLLSGDVAAATVLLCRHLVDGASWEKAVLKAAEDRLPETQSALLNPSGRSLNHGGFAPEVLRAAVSFVSAENAFATAMEAAIAFAGPSNYCPVLVGAIAGARWGASEIPRSMLSHVGITGRVERVAGMLSEAWL